MRRLALFSIRCYQRWLSPVVSARAHCRFHPTCSAYAASAIERYGFVRGAWMAIRRLERCRPDNFDSCIDFP